MINKTALIHQNATIGANVEIGPFTIIHDGVVIGDNSVIGSHCEIGIPTKLAHLKFLSIGNNSVIRSHSVIYIGSDISAKFQTGHHICIRENTIIGEGCQVGSRSDIQGDCSLGRYVKLHSDVHIGKKSKIGDFVWMFPEVLLTNDPTPPSEILIGPIIEDFVILASKVLVFPGVKIEKDAVIAAGTIVKENVPNGKVVAGNPAKILCDAKILRLHGNPKIKAYPWRNRFHRGYEDADVQNWLREIDKL
jgi:UDP-3-O-[3-hydroxymyristoyl] glucosamine N-acyltransferase